jgi:hypothetical protein
MFRASAKALSAVGALELSRRQPECGWSEWFGMKQKLYLSPHDIYVWGTPSGVNGQDLQTFTQPTRISTVPEDTSFTSVALAPSHVVAATVDGSVLLWCDPQEEPVVLYKVSSKPKFVTHNKYVCLYLRRAKTM